MGMKKGRRPASGSTGLADALFSATQQRVLGLLFGQPERSFYATEVIERSSGGSGAVQRELARLERSGLTTSRRIGSQKHYQANPESPIFQELCGLFRKTVGLADPVRKALKPLKARIAAAFIYGSVAKRQEHVGSDIDLMVISDRLSYADLFAALEPASKDLGRTINPTVHTQVDFRKRLKQGNSFMARVMAQPKIWIVGGENDLAA